jgi:8-oxo-dGTP diphosphatase
MPLCHDHDLIRPFIAKNLPAANTVLHLVNNTFVSSLRWVRVDDLADPHALLCRTHRFTLFADSGRAAARVLAEVPRNLRLVFSATPTRFCRLIRTHWRGPDAGRRLWYNHCYLYVLRPGRLVIDRNHRVSRLRPEDAMLIAQAWPYGRSPEHILRRIRSGPGYCIRRNGAPVAWGLTHDDGSMGFLHVVERYRHQGMARTLTTALAQSLLRLGVQPFMYIVTSNTASLRLTASMGFSRAGRFTWMGST